MFEGGVGGFAGVGGRICPEDAPLDLRSFEDEVALIHSDSRGESCVGGSVACKSHCDDGHYSGLKCWKPLRAEKGLREQSRAAPRAGKGSVDASRYLHTVRQTSWHCTAESVDVRSTPSCAEGRTPQR